MTYILAIDWLLVKVRKDYRRLCMASETYQPFNVFLPELIRYTFDPDPDDEALGYLTREIGRMGLSFSDLDDFVSGASEKIINELRNHTGERFKRYGWNWRLSNDYRTLYLSD